MLIYQPGKTCGCEGCGASSPRWLWENTKVNYSVHQEQSLKDELANKETDLTRQKSKWVNLLTRLNKEESETLLLYVNTFHLHDQNDIFFIKCFDVCREFQSYSHCNICFTLFPFSFTTIQIVETYWHAVPKDFTTKTKNISFPVFFVHCNSNIAQNTKYLYKSIDLRVSS